MTSVAIFFLSLMPQDSTPPALELCLEAHGDYSPLYPTNKFPSKARKLVAVFHLGPDDHFKKLEATWIAVDVGDAAPANTKIDSAPLRLNDERAGVFRISGFKNDPPVGRYRLDVEADGKSWKSAECEVVADEVPLKLASPEDLLPLKTGTMWTYSFTQQPGKGAKLTAPEGFSLDPDGHLRTTGTVKVTKNDASGIFVEWRLGKTLLFDQTWKLEDSGLLVTHRKTDEENILLDPPQPFIPLPLGNCRSWEYETKDQSVKQSYSLWGPLPVQSPEGKVPGYVIMATEKGDLGTTTLEQHIVPGIGLVREVRISTLATKLVDRTEMVLKNKP